MTLGLFIGRLNPPHIWHTWIIKKALDENDEVIILLWSNYFNDENNPLDFNKRKKIIQKKFKNKNLKIIEILDCEIDLEWVKNIYEILKREYIWTEVNFYAWDFENDSAYNVVKEYEKEFKNIKFNYIEETRKNSFIKYEWKEYQISATNLRNVFKKWKIELAEPFCDKEIFDEIKKYLIK